MNVQQLQREIQKEEIRRIVRRRARNMAAIAKNGDSPAVC